MQKPNSILDYVPTTSDGFIAGTRVKFIPELMDEVVATVAGHYGATVDETVQAFGLDTGNVRKNILELYLRLYLELEPIANLGPTSNT